MTCNLGPYGAKMMSWPPFVNMSTENMQNIFTLLKTIKVLKCVNHVNAIKCGERLLTSTSHKIELIYELMITKSKSYSRICPKGGLRWKTYFNIVWVINLTDYFVDDVRFNLTRSPSQV